MKETIVLAILGSLVVFLIAVLTIMRRREVWEVRETFRCAIADTVTIDTADYSVSGVLKLLNIADEFNFTLADTDGYMFYFTRNKEGGRQ